MSFIEEIKNRARKNIKTIALPEANDIRTLEAADIILKEGFSNITLIRKRKRNFRTCTIKKFRYLKSKYNKSKNFN